MSEEKRASIQELRALFGEQASSNEPSKPKVKLPIKPRMAPSTAPGVQSERQGNYLQARFFDKSALSPNNNKSSTIVQAKVPLKPPVKARNSLPSGQSIKSGDNPPAVPQRLSMFNQRSTNPKTPPKPVGIKPKASAISEQARQSTASELEIQANELYNQSTSDKLDVHSNEFYHFGSIKSSIQGNDNSYLKKSSHYHDEQSVKYRDADNEYEYADPITLPHRSNENPKASDLSKSYITMQQSKPTVSGVSRSRFFIPFEPNAQVDSSQAALLPNNTSARLHKSPSGLQIVANSGYHKLPRCRSAEILNSFSSSSTEYIDPHVSTRNNSRSSQTADGLPEYQAPWDRNALMHELDRQGKQLGSREETEAYQVSRINCDGTNRNTSDGHSWTYEDVNIERLRSDISGSSSKLVTIRERVNTCFTNSTEGANPSVLEQDTDSLVDIEEIDKRVEYVSVTKSYVSRQSRRHYACAVEHRHAYQLFLHVTLSEQTRSTGTEQYESLVREQLPTTPRLLRQHPQESTVVDSTLLHLCIPESTGYDRRRSDGESKCYCFILTDETGQRRLGYCRRFHLDSEPFPEIICFVSDARSTVFYNELLSSLEAARRKSTEDMYSLAIKLHKRPLPRPAASLLLTYQFSDGSQEKIDSRRCADLYRDTYGVSSVLSQLGADMMLLVFASLLLERRVVLTSICPERVSNCVMGLSTLLYPLSWQHTLIPVLPPTLLELCCTPTPFLVGLLKPHLAALSDLPTEQMLVCDLDRRVFIEHQSDERTILPSRLYKFLLSSLKMADDAKKKYNDSDKDMIIQEAFLRFFVEILGNFEKFFVDDEFQRAAFVDSARSKSLRQFLSWFSRCLMVDVFVAERRAGQLPDSEAFNALARDRQCEQNAWPALKENLKDFGKKMKQLFGKNKGVKV